MDKIKILAVDDEPGFTRMLKIALPKYEVRTENDSRHAVEAAKEFKPDLILLDLVMPEIDGGTLARIIKSDAMLCRTPIIFLTAIAPPDEHGRTPHRMSGFPILSKPASAEAIEQCIEQCLAA